MIGCCNARTLKDCMVKPKITNTPQNLKVCQYIQETCKFENADGNKYDIRKGVINCNTDFSIDKFHCSCSKQYVGNNITDFLYRFNSFMTQVSICSGNQWTGFYMIETSVMKELITIRVHFVKYRKHPKDNQEHFSSTLNYLNTTVWITGG